jgi:hypothetical protein
MICLICTCSSCRNIFCQLLSCVLIKTQSQEGIQFTKGIIISYKNLLCNQVLKMEWQIPFLEFLSSMFNKIHCGLVWPCSTNNSNHNLLHSSKRNLANNSHVKNKTGENDPFVSKWYIELSVVFNTR